MRVRARMRVRVQLRVRVSFDAHLHEYLEHAALGLGISHATYAYHAYPAVGDLEPPIRFES